MKKIDNKFVIVNASSDLEKIFAMQGELGYSFKTAIPNPLGGVKFYFERTSDEDVSPDALELEKGEDLAKKWGG